MSELVLAERRGPVLVLTLNRPERLNSWTDADGAVAFLASARASWNTGTTLVSDGGQLLVTPVADSEAERLA